MNPANLSHLLAALAGGPRDLADPFARDAMLGGRAPQIGPSRPERGVDRDMGYAPSAETMLTRRPEKQPGSSLLQALYGQN